MKVIVTVVLKMGNSYHTDVHVFSKFPSHEVVKAMAQDAFVVHISATNTKGEVVFVANRKAIREWDNKEIKL